MYRVLDIVFAEGLEAMFRFSLAILLRSEDKLLGMEFEQILSYLQSDLFEIYRVDLEGGEKGKDQDSQGDENWKANEFVRDAYEIRMYVLFYSRGYWLMIERHSCLMRMKLNMRKCARIKINMRTNWICCGMPIDR